jgi:hypothetical protein
MNERSNHFTLACCEAFPNVSPARKTSDSKESTPKDYLDQKCASVTKQTHTNKEDTTKGFPQAELQR